jgi:hypothetical protein
MAVFWVVVLYSLVEVCYVSEVLADSIIRAIALMVEAASSSEKSVNFYQIVQQNNPEDSHLHTRRCENLKSHPITVHTWLVLPLPVVLQYP